MSEQKNQPRNENERNPQDHKGTPQSTGSTQARPMGEGKPKAQDEKDQQRTPKDSAKVGGDAHKTQAEQTGKPHNAK